MNNPTTLVTKTSPSARRAVAAALTLLTAVACSSGSSGNGTGGHGGAVAGGGKGGTAASTGGAGGIASGAGGKAGMGVGGKPATGGAGGTPGVGGAAPGGAMGVGGSGSGGADLGGSTGSGGLGAGGAGVGGSVGVACLGRDINVADGIVSGTIKLGGTTVSSTSDYGNLVLRRGTTDEVPLGETSDSSYSVRTVPGTYDLYYKAVATASAAPRNTLGLVRSGVVISPTGTTALDIDVPTVAVSGQITIGGAAVASASDFGTIFLRNAAGDEVLLATSNSGSFLVRATPGTYSLYYRAGTVGATAPRNTSAKLKETVVLPAVGTTSLDVDIPSVTVSGSITVGGAAAISTGDFGSLFLRNAAGDEIALGATYNGTYSLRVIPGTYDLFYKAGTIGAVAPRNVSAKLQSAVVIAATGSTALDINVPSAVVSGSIKIAGAAATSTSDYGTMFLRNAAGDEVTLGATYSGSYSVRAVPGTYDLYYKAGTVGAFAPRNTSAKVQAGVVVAAGGTTALDIDVPSVVATGTMRIAGASVTSTSDYGMLFLRTAAGDEVSLGNTYAGSYSVRAVPGTYDVYYKVGVGGSFAPRNTSARVRSAVALAAGGTTALDIDVPSVLISGSLKIGGATVTSASDYGTLSLRDAKGDEVTLGATSAGAYSIRTVPGLYDLVYTVTAAGSLAPRNSGARLGCFDVQ